MTRCGPLLFLLAASQALSQPPVEVATKGCEGLNEAELLRLLAIELSAVQPPESALQAPTVDVHCQGGWVRLTLVDRDSGGYLDRVIPAPAADDPGRERVVALAASQLVLAWLPRRAAAAAAPAGGAGSPDAGSPVEVPPRDQPGTAEPVEDAARPERLDQGAPGLQGHFVLALRGGGRLGDLVDGPLPMATGGLFAGYGLAPRWMALLGAELATGTAHRDTGVVDVDTAQAGLGVLFVTWQGPLLRLELDLALYVRHVSLAGALDAQLAQRRDAQQFDREGVGFDGALSFGPVLQAGGAAVGVKLRGGVTAGGPLGRVSAERPVARAGPWLGLALELGAHLGRTP